MKKHLITLLLGGTLALASPHVFAEKIILKFGHVGNPGSLFEASVNEFVKNAKVNVWFVLVLLVVLMLCTYVPAVPMSLVHYFYG